MRLSIPILFSLIVLSLSWSDHQLSPGSYLHPASRNQEDRAPCAQPAPEQAAIFRKAQTEKYSLRRIEFIGNADTNDGTLRRRIALKEGNVFARAILIKSLKSLSKLRSIHPVRLSDVLAHMNDQEKTIDVVICIREKKQLRSHEVSTTSR
jgi:outer membrane protein assembly factor BamA